ncbi:hypothetical protein [Pseudomonas sp. CC6-YY-74]|nr:hypothetical protein [Pseudomonas sp. CC6-YY-74]
MDQLLTQLRHHGCQRLALETAQPRHGFTQTSHLTLTGLQQHYLQTGGSD